MKPTLDRNLQRLTGLCVPSAGVKGVAPDLVPVSFEDNSPQGLSALTKAALASVSLGTRLRLSLFISQKLSMFR